MLQGLYILPRDTFELRMSICAPGKCPQSGYFLACNNSDIEYCPISPLDHWPMILSWK